MTLARQVFGQNAVARPQAVNRAIAEPDLECSRQCDYVLAARCVVPIGKVPGLILLNEIPLAACVGDCSAISPGMKENDNSSR